MDLIETPSVGNMIAMQDRCKDGEVLLLVSSCRSPAAEGTLI